MALSTDVEYLNSRDATIMGSRNGHAPIYLWYTLTRKVSWLASARQAVKPLLLHFPLPLSFPTPPSCKHVL